MGKAQFCFVHSTFVVNFRLYTSALGDKIPSSCLLYTCTTRSVKRRTLMFRLEPGSWPCWRSWSPGSWAAGRGCGALTDKLYSMLMVMAAVMTTIPKRLPHSSYSDQWYFSNDFIISYFPRKFPALKTDLGQNRLWRRMGCNRGKATTTDANFKYVVCFVSMSRTKCWVFLPLSQHKENPATTAN